LLALSSEIIDNGLIDRPFNRTSNELSEIGDGLAVVESFSHSVVLDTGEGLVAFDASHAQTGERVVAAIKGWSAQPVSHIVYTHGHADHVGGSVAFGAEYGDMTVVGHRNVERRFDRYAETNDWNVQINARQFGGVKGDFGMGGEGTADLPEFIPNSTTLAARPTITCGLGCPRRNGWPSVTSSSGTFPTPATRRRCNDFRSSGPKRFGR